MVERNSDEGDQIASNLREALRLSRAVLTGVVSTDEVRGLLELRGPLLEAAEAARLGGNTWGRAEAQLASRLRAVDQQIIDALWEPRKDAFGWLVERSPEVSSTMPALANLPRD